MAVCHAIPSALLRQPWPGVQLFRLCPRNCRREIRLVAASLSCGSPRQTHTAGPPFPTCLHSVRAVSLPAEAVGEQGQHSNSRIASVCFWAVCSAPALSLERHALSRTLGTSLGGCCQMQAWTFPGCMRTEPEGGLEEGRGIEAPYRQSPELGLGPHNEL